MVWYCVPRPAKQRVELFQKYPANRICQSVVFPGQPCASCGTLGKFWKLRHTVIVAYTARITGRAESQPAGLHDHRRPNRGVRAGRAGVAPGNDRGVGSSCRQAWQLDGNVVIRRIARSTIVAHRIVGVGGQKCRAVPAQEYATKINAVNGRPARSSVV